MILTVISVVGYGTAVASNLVRMPVGDPENPNPAPSPMSSYVVSVHPAGTGVGVVTSTPAGIHCGTECDASFDAGTTVTLTARAGSTSKFQRFGAPCAGKKKCTFQVTSGKTVNAVFAKQAALLVARTGKGTVKSGKPGIKCPGRCKHAFTKGATVKLKARAAHGWRFQRWTGACAGKRPSCSVRLKKARHAVAHFVHPHR